MDWASRKVLAWRLSIAMDTEFCIEALEAALGHCGTPEILYGAQPTGRSSNRRGQDVSISRSVLCEFCGS